jgi:hypothetical protein
LEAMACGRAAIVYDYLGGDGMVTPHNIEEIRKHNFSGRRFKRDYNATDLIQEIKKYRKFMGEINRQIILKEHNASVASDKIINICNQAQNDFCQKPVTIPYKKWKTVLAYYKVRDKILPPNSRRKRFAKVLWGITNRSII